MNSRNKRFAGYRYPAEIISHAVWLYFRFALSFRDVEGLLAARGDRSDLKNRAAMVSDVRPAICP